MRDTREALKSVWVARKITQNCEKFLFRCTVPPMWSWWLGQGQSICQTRISQGAKVNTSTQTQHSFWAVVSKVVWICKTLDFIIKNMKFSLSGIDHHVFLCSSESKLSFHRHVSSSSEKLEWICRARSWRSLYIISSQALKLLCSPSWGLLNNILLTMG